LADLREHSAVHFPKKTSKYKLQWKMMDKHQNVSIRSN